MSTNIRIITLTFALLYSKKKIDMSSYMNHTNYKNAFFLFFPSAYILSDLGYDVWLGNARGSTYSKEHETLNTSDPKFWDFRYK